MAEPGAAGVTGPGHAPASKFRKGEMNELWNLGKEETLAYSEWLIKAELIRNQINQSAFLDWDKTTKEHRLSKCVLQRYIDYVHVSKRLIPREALGTHPGTYAEDLIAAIVRARIAQECPDVEVQQNKWHKTPWREADISLLRNGSLRIVIEVKSALTKDEWEKIQEAREAYKKLDDPPSYWLVAIRVDALDAALKEAIDNDAHCCVLSKEGRKLITIPADKLQVWKPLEPWLDNLIAALKSDLALEK
jgi:hypothetical protein